MKRINNRWTKAESFAPFGDSVSHWDPFLSIDGKKLYFSANIKGVVGIWFVEKQGSVWSNPQSISPVINGSKGQCQAVLNSNGTAYFSNGVARTSGCIVRSKFKNNIYLKPDTLPTCINMGRYNSDPYIAPDDSYLLFASRRLNDQVDIYISFHDTLSDTWSEPVNMGELINKNLQPSYLGIDRFPAISPDGKYLFFSRYNGYNNDCDVFWVSANIIDRLKEKSKIKK
jgi:Tol biopolymer transport system component